MFKKRHKDPRLKRLDMEYQLLDDMCKHSDMISYEVINPRKGIPPDNYYVYFNLKSIVGIDDNNAPIYGHHHKVHISLPQGYPMISSPICHMKTDTWHPNIRSKGEFKGHICINENVLGFWHTLDMLVTQVGEMLQYKNYHALEIQPYPEDAIVARWVREYAEPNNIVNKEKKIYTDDRALLKPTEKWLSSRKRRKKIIILKIRKRKTNGLAATTLKKKNINIVKNIK